MNFRAMNRQILIAFSAMFLFGNIAPSIAQAQREWDPTMGRAPIIGTAATGHGLAGDGGAQVETLEIYNSELLAGGSFDTTGTDQIAGLARWNDSTGYWDEFAGGVWHYATGAPGRVHDLASFKQGSTNYLLVIGDFDTVGRDPEQVTADHLAIWNGASWEVAPSGLPSPSAHVKFLRCVSIPTTMGNSVPLLLIDDSDTEFEECNITEHIKPTVRVYILNSIMSSWVPTNSTMGPTMKGSVDEWSSLDALNLPTEFGGSEAQVGILTRSYPRTSLSSRSEQLRWRNPWKSLADFSQRMHRRR